LLDEELKAYTLATVVRRPTSQRTQAAQAALRFIAIVAQTDGVGDIKPAIQASPMQLT
jgi:hypothetical protein